MKCTRSPSIVVVYWSNLLSAASCFRQSYLTRQYATSSFMYDRLAPYSQPEDSISSGNLVLARRSLRSRSTESGTWILNGTTASSGTRAPFDVVPEGGC